MSSKKPVSRLRQVIPVKKRVSDIVLPYMQLKHSVQTVHVTEKWKISSFTLYFTMVF